MSISWPKIILFGDSQVQRSFEPENGLWGALLANRFQRICDVVPRGFSGYTTRSGRIVLPRILCPENVSDIAAVLIFLGTNDYSGKEEANANHVPLEEYFSNLAEMIKYLQLIGIGKEKIILMTPGPYAEDKWQKTCAEMGRAFPSRNDDDLVQYVKTCVNVAVQCSVDVVNIYQEMKKHEDWEKYLLDGIHVSRDGSYFIYNALWPFLEKRIQGQVLLLPYWRDINSIHLSDANDELCNKKCPRIVYA